MKNLIKRKFYLLCIMLLMVFGASLLSFYTLYQAAFNQKQNELVNIVKSQARIIESVAEFDSKHSTSFPGGAVEATLSQIRKSQENILGFGETGEFNLGKLEQGQIVLMMKNRHSNTPGKNISINSKYREAMRRALRGESGTIIGLDYRGEKVLAAYEPVEILNFGLVAKVDLSEIRNPFIKAGYLTGLGILLILFAGAFAFIKTIDPMISSIVKSEERFRTIFNEAPLGVALIDSLTGFIYEVNSRFAEISGRSMDELKTIDWMQITHLDDIQEDLDNMALLNAGKQSGFNMEKRYIQPDGTNIWINLTVASISASDEQSPRHLAMIEDITERKLNECELLNDKAHLEDLVEIKAKELNKSLQRSKSYFEMPLIGLLVSLPNKEFIEANDRICEMLGFSREELLKLTWADITHPDDLDQDTNLFHQVYSGKLDRYHLEKKYIKKNGETIDVEIYVGCVRNSQGQPEYFVAMIQDISARKKVENERIKLDKMKSDFLSTAAHELRTPLTMIRGYSELLCNKQILPYEQIKRYTLLIQESSKNLANIIDDLLDISKIEEGTSFSLNIQLGDISEVIKMEQAAFAINTKDNSFNLEIFGDKYDILIDPERIRQVLKNIYSNSVKYSKSKSSISTKIFYNESAVLISVEDQGRGMTSEELELVFEKFYRSENVKHINGTGLGMHIIKFLVESHGGKVEIESEVDVGTTVTLEFPKISPTWKDEYSVKIPSIDIQHKKLINHIQRLVEAIANGEKINDIDSIIDEIEEYGKFHARYEEDLLRKYEHPHIIQHEKNHKFFEEQIEAYRRASMYDKHHVLLKVTSFLYSWLTSHILVEDKSYAEFLLKQGFYENSAELN